MTGGKGPIYDAYPDWEGKTIMAWAWGLMRIIDYLLTCDYIDPDRIIVTGCSRLGKQALCAAIHDTRVALAGITVQAVPALVFQNTGRQERP